MSVDVKYFIINIVGFKSKKEMSKIFVREKFKLFKYLILWFKLVCVFVKYKIVKIVISMSWVSKVLWMEGNK